MIEGTHVWFSREQKSPHPWRPRGSQLGRQKKRTKVFKYVHENVRPAFSHDPTAPRSPRMKSLSFFTQKWCNISLAYPRSFTSQKGSCILIAFSHVFAGIVRVQKNFMAPKWRYVFWCHAPENESTILRTSITIYPVVRKQRLSIIKHTVINFTNEPITWILSR